MKGYHVLLAASAVATGLAVSPLQSLAVPLVLVPGDQATLPAALAAVDPGGVVRITDSGVYEGQIVFTKAGVTLEAAPGTNPTILYPEGGPSYLVYANQPVKIGSSAGGRITMDGGMRVGLTTMLNADHGAGLVTFENLHVVGMTAPVNVIYPNPGTADVTVRDTIIDANFECQFPVRLDFVNPGDTLTFENVAVLGAASRGIFTSSAGGGTFNLINSYIESVNTAMELTTGAGAYTINITGSYIYSQFGNSSGGALYARSSPNLTATNSVFRCSGLDAYAIYLFTDGASTSGGSFNFTNCDIIGDGTTFAALRLVSSPIGDTITIRDTNVMHLRATSRSLFGSPAVADVVTLDYNSLSGSRDGFPATQNVEYNIIPDYVSIPAGDFAYTDATLIVGDTQGDPVGSFTNFRGVGEVLLVELESFAAHSSGAGHPVSVEWSTSSEIDNVGFNLLRVRFENGYPIPSGKVNNQLIPGAGTSADGAEYDYLDPLPLQHGEKRGYVLVDIDANGTATRHGPIGVQVQPGDPSGEQDWMFY
jgi:hypothetical protein